MLDFGGIICVRIFEEYRWFSKRYIGVDKIDACIFFFLFTIPLNKIEASIVFRKISKLICHIPFFSFFNKIRDLFTFERMDLLIGLNDIFGWQSESFLVQKKQTLKINPFISWSLFHINLLSAVLIQQFLSLLW